jgi:hypothetical protein
VQEPSGHHLPEENGVWLLILVSQLSAINTALADSDWINGPVGPFSIAVGDHVNWDWIIANRSIRDLIG